MTKQNSFIWQQLVTSNQQASGKFISNLLGWELKQVDARQFGGYTFLLI